MDWYNFAIYGALGTVIIALAAVGLLALTAARTWPETAFTRLGCS